MSNGVNKPSGEAIDPRLVRELADILRDTELTEIEVEREGLRIRVAREVTMTAAPVQYAAAPAPAAVPAPVAPASTPTAPAAVEPAAAKGDQIKSPMVGTVYLQPSPGSDPFVTPGAKVKAGQTLLIIEAMKTMNPIPAPRDGTVVEILAGDGQPVEFGEPLVVIE